MIRSQSILEALDAVMRDPVVDTPFACPKCDYRFTGPSRVPWLSMILCPKCGSRIEYSSDVDSNEEPEREEPGEEKEEKEKPKSTKKKKPKPKPKKPKKKEPESESEAPIKSGQEDWESELDSYLR